MINSVIIYFEKGRNEEMKKSRKKMKMKKKKKIKARFNGEA
jgi:hypothetical protein